MQLIEKREIDLDANVRIGVSLSSKYRGWLLGIVRVYIGKA
jgi:hypothetical protein